MTVNVKTEIGFKGNEAARMLESRRQVQEKNRGMQGN